VFALGSTRGGNVAVHLQIDIHEIAAPEEENATGAPSAAACDRFASDALNSFGYPGTAKNGS